MALPATSSPSPPLSAHQDWLAEHTQHSHRSSSKGQKRQHDDTDDLDTRSSISTSLKRLRIHHPAPLPQRPVNGFSFRQHDHLLPSNHVLPNSSPFPTSHPAYHEQLPPQPYLHPQPSQTHLVPSPRSLSHYLSPNHPAYERNYTNTPPPQSIASSSRASTFHDAMTLDDTNTNNAHRIVINDLDAEFAEIEAEEEQKQQRQAEQAFFFPDDIEKEINSVPQHVLRNTPPAVQEPSGSQALILYKDPASISVPEEEDAVRKAVNEARARIRDKQRDDSEQQKVQAPRAPPPWPGFEPIMDEDMPQRHQDEDMWDPDAMDIE